MKSIISLMTVATVAFVAQSATLDDLYSKICIGKVYTENGVDVTYYQPWEALLGYTLGTQANPTDTSSTCYGQVSETYRFIDKIVTQSYDLVFNFNLDTTSSRFQLLA